MSPRLDCLHVVPKSHASAQGPIELGVGLGGGRGRVGVSGCAVRRETKGLYYSSCIVYAYRGSEEARTLISFLVSSVDACP